jgi:MFS family permease
MAHPVPPSPLREPRDRSDASLPATPSSSSTAVDVKPANEFAGITSSNSQTSTLTPEKESSILKAAYRKVDLRLLVPYSIVNVLIVISTHNISNSQILNVETGDGIMHQLGNLSSEQWAWIMSVFYYSYIAFEPASTPLFKYFGPRQWMGRLFLTWGIISMCQAAVQNFGGMIALRFLLGAGEAGFQPCILYHLSFWYSAEKLTFRVAFFFTCAVMSGVFSGLLAFGIAHLNGKAGLAGWRWLFLLEGIPVVIAGLWTIFFLPAYPEKAKFFTEEQKSAVLSSRPDTQPKAEAKVWEWKQVKAFVRDPISYGFLVIWICHSMGGWGLAKQSPTVIFQLGLEGSTMTQLLTMPAYGIGGALGLTIAWLIRAGKLKPWPTALVIESLLCGCYIAVLIVRGAVVKYILVSMTIILAFPVTPILWAERIRTAKGTTATGLAIAVTNIMSHVKGLVGPQMWQLKFGPHYRVSIAACVGILGLAIAAMACTWVLIRKRDARMVEEKASEVEAS